MCPRRDRMAASHRNSEGLARGTRTLHTALGPAIARCLVDVSAVEVMLNPVRRIWIDRLSEGLSDTGERLSPDDGERFGRLVAHHVGAEVHAGTAARFGPTARDGGTVRGTVTAGRFRPGLRHPQIRRRGVHARRLCRRRDHVGEAGPGAARWRSIPRQHSRAGVTSAGKTTLTNALLAEVAKISDRVVIIEDTRELQFAPPNLVAMRTKDGVASLSDFVRSSLRLRPDRIPVARCAARKPSIS